MKISKTHLTVVLILALAVAMRLWRIGWDLPYVAHPDEPVSINVALQIFRSGDLNPRFFDYPSLYFYLNALAYAAYYAAGYVAGAFSSRLDIAPLVIQAMGTTYAPLAAPVIASRLLTAAIATGSVGLVYYIGRRLSTRPSVGLVAALVLAVSPTNVMYGRAVTPDSYALFFILAAFAGAVLIYQRGRTGDYVLAGCMTGLAVSCKYNAALIVLPIIVAHFLRWRRRGLTQPHLYVSAVSAVLAFLLTTPYAILDHGAFIKGMSSTTEHYSTGHPGMEGDTLRWYLRYLWSTHGPLLILSLAAMLWGASRRRADALLLAVYPIVYFALISQYVVRNERTVLLLMPFLFLLAALLLEPLDDWLERRLPQASGRLRGGALTLAAVILIAWPFAITMRSVLPMPSTAAEDAARDWILEQAPAGVRVAIESYAPFLPPERYEVSSAPRMIDRPTEWYAENGIAYLVFSEGMYGRFYRDPVRYQAEVARYDELFRRYQPVAVFDQGGHEIRVSRVTEPK